MEPNSIANSALGMWFIKALAAGMESRFRYRFFGPENILKNVDGLSGKTVLELGCGTGFFTLPAARMIGEEGSLTSMDVFPASVELVSQKVQAAGLKNARVLQGDAMDTRLPAAAFDTVFLFGVIPAPMIPLAKLLPEIRRVLRPGGTLAVWPPIPGWLPKAVLESGLFTLAGRRGGVFNFRRA